MLFSYVQNDILCLILLVSILVVWQGKSLALPGVMKTFNKVVVTAIVMCFSDMLCYLSNGQTYSNAFLVITISQLIYYLSVSFISYYWLIYIGTSIPGSMNRISFSVARGAIIAASVLVLTNPATKLLFSVDANNIYSRGPFIYFHWLFSWGFCLWASFIVFKAMLKANTPAIKRQFYPRLLFLAFPSVAALIQMNMPGTSLMQCGVTLSIVIIALNHLENQVVRDPLTGLNNRNALDEHLNSQIDNSSCLSVCIVDADSFKLINDRFGHNEGDKALKVISDALKEAVYSCEARMFLCRYGGDEFLICCSGADGQAAFNKLKKNTDRYLSDYNSKEFRGYILSVSMGMATGICNEYTDIERLISEADSKMYEEKQLKHTLSGISRSEYI